MISTFKSFAKRILRPSYRLVRKSAWFVLWVSPVFGKLIPLKQPKKERVLAVYDTTSQKCIASRREDAAVSVLAWSPDDHGILAGYASGRLCLFASRGAPGPSE